MSSGGQVVGGIVGAVIGFYIDGPAGALKGASIGMTVGGVIDPPKGPVIRGPRLDDLSVQTSTYGAFIPRLYGTTAISGNVLWVQGDKLTEVKKLTDSGGKGGPTQTTETFEYFATFAVGLCEGPIVGVRRVWIGGQLWYDAGAGDLASIVASNEKSSLFTLYTGTETQLANPLIQADKGVANVPAYRGLSYIVLDTLPLANYSNSLMGAQVKVEIVKTGTIGYSITNAASATTNVLPYSLDVSGNRAFVLNNTSSTLQLFDIANPADMRAISSAAATANPVRVRVHNNYAYVVSYNSTLQIFAATGDALTLISTTSLPNFGVCLDVATINGFVYAFVGTYAGSSAGRLSVYDVTDPAMPAMVGSVGTGYLDATTNLSDLRYYLGHVYIACANSVGLQVYSVANISAPVLVGSYVIGSTLSCVRLMDNYAYVLDYAAPVKLYIFNITVPSAPTLAGSVTTSGSCKNLAVLDDYVYAVSTNTNELQVFDVTLPSVPVSVALAAAATTPFGVQLSAGYIFYIAQNNSLNASVFSGKKITSIPIPLSEIVSAECLKSKLLTAPDIGVDELTDTVRGYRVSALGAIRAGLDPLRAAWPFDVVQSGYKIKFKKRGGASVATITAGELDARAAGDAPGVSITDSREMDLVLPYKVGVKYLDTIREYDTNEQYAERLNTDAVNESAIDLPIVFTAAEAAGKAETLLYMYWLERYDVAFKLPPAYAHLEPGDVITINATLATYSLRLTSVHHLPDGRLECKAKYNSASIYTPAAQGAEGSSIGATLTLAGPTTYQLLDIPMLRDANNTAGFPVAMTGYLAGWPGGVLFRSEDAGETWTDLVGFVSPGTVMGYATNALTAHGGTVYDFASTLAVRLYQGTLSNVTEAQLFAAQNWFAYGVDGRWEIIAARIATLQSDGSYILRDFLRGQLGTEWATGLHALNDSIVRLNAASLEFVNVNASTIGSVRNYRGITSGKALDSDGSRAFTYRAVNLECLNPVHATGSRHRTTNDWTLTWVRRTRFAGWRDLVDAVLGEATESYEVDIFSSSTYLTLKRTLTSATQTVVYTSANQVTDFGSNQATLYLKIYQLSATVGRGYPLTISLTR